MAPGIARLVHWHTRLRPRLAQLLVVDHPDPVRRVLNAGFGGLMLTMIGLSVLAIPVTITFVGPIVLLVAAGFMLLVACVWRLNQRGSVTPAVVISLATAVVITLFFQPSTYVSREGYPIIHIGFTIAALICATVVSLRASLAITAVQFILLAGKAWLLQRTAGSTLVNFMLIGVLNTGILIAVATIFAERLARSIRQADDDNRKLEQRVAERTITLQRLLDSWATLTSQATHDLRSLMSISQGETELLAFELKSGTATDAQIECTFRRILIASELQAGMVEDLHVVSLLERNSAALDLTPRPFDLIERLSHLHTLLESRAAEAQVTVRRCHPEYVMVNADAKRVDRVLWNLLINAIKFTAPAHTDGQGAIAITVERRGAIALITIADNGLGISPECLSRIGQQWQRDVRHGLPAGSGIGLDFCRTLTGLMGGWLKIDSPGINQGATVQLALPLAATEQRTPSAVEQQLATSQRRADG